MITSFLLAGYVYMKTQDKIAALLTQLPWLSYFSLKAFETSLPAIIPVISNVDAEHLLIVFSNLFNLSFMVPLFSKSSRQELIAVLMLCLVCGLGLATKFTFTAPVVVALIIIPWRLKILFIIGFILSFMLGTFPVICKYPLMFKKFDQLFEPHRPLWYWKPKPF